MYVPLISPRYASGDFLPRVLAFMDKFNPVPQSYFGDWNYGMYGDQSLFMVDPNFHCGPLGSSWNCMGSRARFLTMARSLVGLSTRYHAEYSTIRSTSPRLFPAYIDKAFPPHAKLMLAQRYYFHLAASLRKRSGASLAQWSVIVVLAGSLRGCQPANDTRRSDIILGKIETLRSFLGASSLKVAD